MTDNAMTEMDKLAHLLGHWVEHNNDHAANYRTWAEKAEKQGKTETAALLRQAADETDKISGLFNDAEKAMK